MRLALRLLRPAPNQSGKPGLWQDPIWGYWESHGKTEFIAGEQYDQCYHLGCDDIGDLSLEALDQMSDAAAHATISLAQSTQAINGVRGKGNFNTPPGQADDPEPEAITGE